MSDPIQNAEELLACLRPDLLRSILSRLANKTPATCDWKDSLVMRPGYEGE